MLEMDIRLVYQLIIAKFQKQAPIDLFKILPRDLGTFCSEHFLQAALA